MPFPTLSELAAKSVAQGIHAELISLDSILDKKSSNSIVRELLKLDRHTFKKLETYKNQLSITEINLRDWRLDADAVRSLSNFNLVSLDFGKLIQLGDGSSSHPFDIVLFLIRATNNHSRRSMIHLGLSKELRLIEGWEKEVSKMFPNLQSIDLSCKMFNERFQFSNFCTCFPNLLVLDISHAVYLSGLQGIKNLEKLQKLTMYDVEFDDIEGYKELTGLKNLKSLDVSSYRLQSRNSIRYMLAAGVRMEALEFLDCSWTPVTENELKTFARNHPSLKTVVAICTACDQTTISGVKMLNMSSLSSFSECLEYALSTERDVLALDFIQDVHKKLKANPGNLGNFEPRHITNAVLFVLRESFNQEGKFFTLQYYLESGLFEQELSTLMFSTDIPDMIELFYNVFHKYPSTSFKKEYTGFMFRMLEATVNSVRPGILIPDRVLNLVTEMTVELVRLSPWHQNQGIRIIYQAEKWMSWEQVLTIGISSCSEESCPGSISADY
ncbi:hypothetical protein B9Z55_004769 [Caenorhabditis nigoni]|uniref:Uncharacterized protein n=2 Tax=Caenorhabditis nigoni TaxID=1611254 RepID=A0A2G5UY97_9PELO|nr:hypothetical protein B9Z55_004769 [Caenorhabditis nigoni]